MSLTTNIDNIFKKGVIGNVRKAQEDSHDIALKTPNGDLFVVCDGMGGHVGGARASSLAVKSIIEYMQKERYADPFIALDGALQFANKQILADAACNPEFKGMGTTACIVLFQSDGAYIAHVGDSRIYLYLGKEQKLHRITKDHSYVQSLVDVGEITDEEAEHHPHKNRILKALGVTENLLPSFNPENKPVRPKNGDIFLICSDGLSGMIPDSTIERVLGQNTSLESKGEMLINLAMEGETVQPGGQDNCTLELIQVDNSPWKTSEYVSFNPHKSGINPQKSGNNTNTRRKRFPIILAIILVVLALFIGAGAAGAYLIYKNKNDKHEAALQVYHDRIHAATDSIKKLDSRKKTLQYVIDHIDIDIDKQPSRFTQYQDYQDSLRQCEDLISEQKRIIIQTQDTLDSLRKK